MPPNERSVQAMDLLKKHRGNLLDKIHEDQKAIDCLDYLVFTKKYTVKTKNEKKRVEIKFILYSHSRLIKIANGLTSP